MKSWSNEIESLPSERLLCNAGSFEVYIAEAHEIPSLFSELGRIRSASFEKAGMHTGKEIDIDRFDQYYSQLILWDKIEKKLVGGYRIGNAEQIVRNQGLVGLYTNMYFDFTEEFRFKLNNSLELGRGVVRNEYQKSPLPLALLWKGLGSYASSLYGEDWSLFGVVAITNSYKETSQMLILSYLRHFHFDIGLSNYVKTNQTLEISPNHALDVDSVQTLRQRVNECEGRKQDIPILIKKYLELGGTFFGFNRNPHFSNAMDCLVWVESRSFPEKIRRRFCGGFSGSPLQPRELAIGPTIR